MDNFHFGNSLTVHYTSPGVCASDRLRSCGLENFRRFVPEFRVSMTSIRTGKSGNGRKYRKYSCRRREAPMESDGRTNGLEDGR